MTEVLDALSWLALLGGSAFCIVGAIGLLRMPDFWARTHAAGLTDTLGAGRETDRPLLVGSVKTNLGHLESASGIASVIKMVLALQYQTLPAQLHLEQPNQRIAWSGLPVRVLTEATRWRRGERPRVAGVSSFGISGTNAHVIIEEHHGSLEAGAGTGLP